MVDSHFASEPEPLFAVYTGMGSDSSIEDDFAKPEAEPAMRCDFDVMDNMRDEVGYGAALHRRYCRLIASEAVVGATQPKFQEARAVGEE
eukprot:6703774-Pyramimonas_sp.AAC.1